MNTPGLNTRPESKEAAISFEIKGISGLNTASYFCCKLDHIASPLWSEHQTRGGMAQSVEHIVHIDGVVGSSPTVTTTNPVGVQVQRLPDFFAYPSRVRTFRSQEYALFCQRGTQKGYADHLKTAYSLRQLVHINMLHILLVLKTRQPFEIKRRGGFPKWFDVSTI